MRKLQDPKTGGWYQVMDRSGDKGNYVESSCSAMFIYSLFKAVRLGYIDKSYLNVALKGYKGFLNNFIEVDKNGVVTVTKACAVAGLGGKVYRSGDYDYYINETIRNNDPKAVGPFMEWRVWNMNVFCPMSNSKSKTRWLCHVMERVSIVIFRTLWRRYAPLWIIR